MWTPHPYEPTKETITTPHSNFPTEYFTYATQQYTPAYPQRNYLIPQQHYNPYDPVRNTSGKGTQNADYHYQLYKPYHPSVIQEQRPEGPWAPTPNPSAKRVEMGPDQWEIYSPPELHHHLS